MDTNDPFGFSRRFGDAEATRASDAEREQLAETLRRHHTDGRLSNDEFEQRVAQAYQAKTIGELHGLLHDLPHADRGLAVPSGRWMASGHRPPLALIAAGGLIALWVLSSVLGLLFSTGSGFHHGGHPPLILVLGLALVVWRLVARRRHRGAARNRAPDTPCRDHRARRRWPVAPSPGTAIGVHQSGRSARCACAAPERAWTLGECSSPRRDGDRPADQPASCPPGG